MHARQLRDGSGGEVTVVTHTYALFYNVMQACQCVHYNTCAMACLCHVIMHVRHHTCAKSCTCGITPAHRHPCATPSMCHIIRVPRHAVTLVQLEAAVKAKEGGCARHRGMQHEG